MSTRVSSPARPFALGRRLLLGVGVFLSGVMAGDVSAQSPRIVLDSARAAARRGAIERATVLYRDLLRTDSTSLPALRELSNVYRDQGKWRDALPLAQRLYTLRVSDFALERDLGQWLAWSGETEAGLVHLRRAVELGPDSSDVRFVLAQTLTWSPATRSEGLSSLRDLAQRYPNDREIRHALASALAWDPPSRAEGIRRLEALVHEDTASLDLLVEFGDVLSWVPETRLQAMGIYDKVSKRSPGNLGAARGRLNILTWNGRTHEALALADSLLAKSPDDSLFLIGRGKLLVQAGRPADAADVLRPQLARSPGNVQLREQLAYALLAAGEFSEARAVAREIQERTYPSAPDWVRRDAAPGAGLDLLWSHTSFGLTLVRALTTVSVPVAPGIRFSVTGGPARFVTAENRFNAGSLFAAIEKRGTALTLARLEVGAERYQNAPSAWTAAAELERGLAGRGTLRWFARRAAVEDSPRAARGTTDSIGFIGQVRANSTGLVLRVPELVAGLSLLGTAGIGVYNGSGLRSNSKRDASLALKRGFGVGARSTRLDIGAGVSYLNFDFNANRSGPGTPRNEYGGYWSPRDFTSAFVTLGLEVPITGRLRWRTDGAVGRLLSGRRSSLSSTSFNVNSELRLTGRGGWDVSGSFFYLDDLGGFRLQQARLGLRHAF